MTPEELDAVPCVRLLPDTYFQKRLSQVMDMRAKRGCARRGSEAVLTVYPAPWFVI